MGSNRSKTRKRESKAVGEVGNRIQNAAYNDHPNPSLRCPLPFVASVKPIENSQGSGW
jgi:hypothetical protein